MIDKYKIKDLKDRLEKETIDNAHKMLYMWIKQNHITLKEYTILVKNLTIQRVSNSVCPICGKHFTTDEGYGEFCSYDCWDTDR